MARHHMTSDGPVPFSAEEETARDAEEKKWADGEVARNAMAEIRRLEATITPRRIRGALANDAGKEWVANVELLIAAERVKL